MVNGSILAKTAETNMFCPISKENCKGNRCMMWRNSEKYGDNLDNIGFCSIDGIWMSLHNIKLTMQGKALY